MQINAPPAGRVLRPPRSSALSGSSIRAARVGHPPGCRAADRPIRRSQPSALLPPARPALACSQLAASTGYAPSTRELTLLNRPSVTARPCELVPIRNPNTTR